MDNAYPDRSKNPAGQGGLNWQNERAELSKLSTIVDWGQYYSVFVR